MSNKKTVEKNTRLMVQELNEQIQKMIDDRDAKLKSAKEQLIDSIKITADKYRTATGVMEALRVMRLVSDGKPGDMQIYDEIEQARDIASRMVLTASNMADKADTLGYGEMDQLCDGFYSTDFISDGISGIGLAEELMHLDLCRNVGPAAEDMVGFIDRVQEEINATWVKLEELYEKDPSLKETEPPVMITEV